MSVPFARARGRRAKVDVTVTRNSIVDSAREVFACYGFGAATYERIGRRIGLSRVAVSNHFPDKQDLYREVVECADARLAAVPAGDGELALRPRPRRGEPGARSSAWSRPSHR